MGDRLKGQRTRERPPLLPLILQKGKREGGGRLWVPSRKERKDGGLMRPPSTSHHPHSHTRPTAPEGYRLRAPVPGCPGDGPPPLPSDAPNRLQLWHSPSPSSCCFLPSPIHLWLSPSFSPPVSPLTHFPSPGLSGTSSLSPQTFLKLLGLKISKNLFHTVVTPDNHGVG